MRFHNVKRIEDRNALYKNLYYYYYYYYIETDCGEI